MYAVALIRFEHLSIRQYFLQSICENQVAILYENIACFAGRRQRRGYHINTVAFEESKIKANISVVSNGENPKIFYLKKQRLLMQDSRI